MINKWILDNFKSINEKKELEFRPLTIFTGANSSGKSTVLQSILLVTQTLQSPMSSRSIILNGTIKKFGTYSDIVNKRKYDKNISIGFDITDDNIDQNNRYLPWGEAVKSLSCIFEILSHPKEDDLQPILEYLNITTVDERDKSVQLKLKKIKTLPDDISHIIQHTKEDINPSDLDYKVEADIQTGILQLGTSIKGECIGVSLNHFLPEYLLYAENRISHLRSILVDTLFGGRSLYLRIEDDEVLKEIEVCIKEKALTIANIIFNKPKKKDHDFEKTYNKLKNEFSLTNLKDFFDISRLLEEEKIKYINLLEEEINKLPELYFIRRIHNYVYPGIEFTKDFFRDRIKYLGPLREEPKSLYPLENNSAMDNVGLRGENTAAVYDYNKNNEVLYIDPEDFITSTNFKLQIKKGSLAKAINKWLIYFDVASKIDTNDMGRIGHELKISTEQGVVQDLTHVGVGVSQILPILVLSFLAKSDDVIIIEQPELHLHPKVQTRLADFFVSMNALGKQCIIETHSEYLINRLRYLVAISKDSSVADNTMIYFVEKEDGASNYRPVKINPYGVIEEWPKGFFDESESLAEAVLRAGVEKRRKERAKDK